MTGRWSCIVLALVLAACRTPKKNVSVYSLADDEIGNAKHLQAGSDVGETVHSRMNLPNYTDTETSTNSPVVSVPASGDTMPVKGEPSVAGKLPVKSTTQTEVRLNSGELPPPSQTNTTAHLDMPSHSSPQNVLPVSQSIHLSLPPRTNSAAREITGWAGLNASQSPVPVHRQLPTRVNIPVNVASYSSSVTESARVVALPVVGMAAPNAGEMLSKPVDLAPLLDGTHDEDWRQQQADQQRVAESARQSARDNLAKTLQQFLQPTSK